MTALLALPLTVGCGGGTKKTNNGDMAMKATGDMAMTSTACTKYTSWPTDMVGAFNGSSSNGFDIGVYADQAEATDSTKTDEVEYEYYASNAPAGARMHTFSDQDTYLTCTDCMYFWTDVYGSPSLYMAQGGSVNVTSIDNTMPTGTVAVSATNLHFVHWDVDQMGNEGPDPDNACVDLTSITMSAMYDNTPTDM